MTNTFPESAPQQVLDLAPDTPTIRRARMRVPNVEVALFVKNEWPLHALGGATGTEPRTLKFDRFPEAFQSAAKHIAYLLINEPTPAEYFNQPGGLSVLWPPVGSILQTMSVLQPDQVKNLLDQLQVLLLKAESSISSMEIK